MGKKKLCALGGLCERKLRKADVWDEEAHIEYGGDKMSGHELEGDEKEAPRGELLVYQGSDGSVKLEVRLEDETVWLTQKLMAELFRVKPQNITIHLKNIYEEGELDEQATCKDFLQVQIEGKREVSRQQKFYNLDAILSVGYRIKSQVATQFRIWATQRLKEYIVKGFVLNDERFKSGSSMNYFDELLARIRDIRSSEKVFWRKVLDIYATSLDYDPKSDVSREFFKVIQNKMHWAAHGQTAAEVIFSRVDASQSNMGMTNWVGSRISKNEAEIAKNYLAHEELDLLNRIVTLYLDFAELQAVQRKTMTMGDWIGKLDDFLKLSGRDILTHAGRIGHDEALQKAHEEYEKFRLQQLEEPTGVERHFIEAEEELKQIESSKKKEGKDGGGL